MSDSVFVTTAIWDFGMEAFYYFGPNHTGCPHFGNFTEMVHTDGPEERNPGCKIVNAHTGLNACTQVFQAIGQGIGHFNFTRGSGFLHMVSGNRDGIELRHVTGRVGKNITYDTHGKLRRIDVRITDHEFFQDIVLDRSRQLFQFGPCSSPDTM